MFERQRSGSVLCPSCHQLVGVNDERCLHCGRRHPGLWGFAGLLRSIGFEDAFVPLVVWSCGILYVLTLAAQPDGIRMDGLFGMLGPGSDAVLRFGGSGANPVFYYDRWWTVLSAGWLHGGLLHILFNMLVVRQLGTATVNLYGPGRTAILYTLSSVTGFAATSAVGWYLRFLPGPLRGAPLTLGASAAIFGLLGALFHYGRRAGSSYIGQTARSYALALGVMGFILPGVDNWAHLGGFVGGYLTSRWLDPLRSESGDHLLWGGLCLLASGVAVLASILMWPLRPSL